MDATWREPMAGEAIRAIAEAAQRGPGWVYVARDATHAALARTALRRDESFGTRPFWDEPVTDAVRLATRLVEPVGTGSALSRPAALAISALLAEEVGLRRDEANRWVTLWTDARLANPGLSLDDVDARSLPKDARAFLAGCDNARRRGRLLDLADLRAALDKAPHASAPLPGPLFLDLVDEKSSAWFAALCRRWAGAALHTVTRGAPAPAFTSRPDLFPDTVAEARAVSRWAAAHAAKGRRVAIQVPNTAVAGRVVEALRDEAVGFSSALGVSLVEFGAASRIRLLLDALERRIGEALRAPREHVELLFEHATRAGIDRDLSRAAAIAASPDGMRTFATCREVIFDAAAGAAAASGRPISTRAFAALARLALASHRTRPVFDPEARVLVVDALRPCPLDVDAVAIVSVSRTLYGRGKDAGEVGAFRARFGLREPAAADARVAALVGAARSVAGDDVWVSGAERHGDEPLTPIRSLLAVARRGSPVAPSVGPFVSDRRVVERNVAVERVRHRAWSPSPHDGVLSPAVAAIVRSQLEHESRGISASQLDEYVVCPFRYFARRILGVAEPEPAGGDIAANKFGTLVHEILATFYAGLSAKERDAERDAEWVSDARARLEEIAHKQLAAKGWPRTYEARVRQDLFGNRCEPGLLARFSEEEARLKTRPLLIEACFGSTTNGIDRLSADPLLIHDAAGRVVARIRGVVDRVDVAPDGQGLVLYDYKTGAVSSPAARILAGTSFQLPVYLLALARAFPGRPVVFGGLYALHDARRAEDFGPRDKFQLRHPGRAKASGLGRGYKSNGQRDDFDDIVKAVAAAVVEHVGAIHAGRFPAGALDEETMGCRGCAFQVACRTDPVRALDVVARRPAEFPLPIAYQAGSGESEEGA